VTQNIIKSLKIIFQDTKTGCFAMVPHQPIY